MELPNTSLGARVFLHYLLQGSFLTCIILLCIAQSATAFTNDTDRLALLTFKDGIYEDTNQVLSSWNDSLHFCMWVGVTCSKRHPQRVMALNLVQLSLKGSLSPHIANLSFLRFINLSINNFQGQIPQEIGQLRRLQFLNLSSNSFDGEIPENITLCSELRVLDLQENKMVGEIPINLDSLTFLSSLDLGKNNFTGNIPPTLGNLSSLTYLNLEFNHLEGSIPNDLGHLVNLKHLHLRVNKLSGMVPSSLYNLSSMIRIAVSSNFLIGSIPPELGLNFPNLEWLAFGRNQFTGHLPISLANATKLLRIDFSGNNFTESLPLSLGRLQDLNVLNVEHNQLDGDLGLIINSLVNCSGLQNLALDDNQFSGMLPSSIGNFSTQLKGLYLGTNKIFGTIPPEIVNLSSLRVLAIEKNLLTGIIPINFGNLQKLDGVNLFQNRLSGEIPSSLGNLTRLLKMDLGRNELGRNIPTSLGDCQSLQYLYLSENNLNGTMPKQVLSISSLIWLFVGMNSLTGTLPLEVSKLENINVLDVSNNKLSGEIPSTISSCIKLESLRMDGNFLQGSIPPSLSALKIIEELDLSRNNLSGPIPKFLEQLPFLQYLNLSFNNFQGEVPKLGVFENVSAISIIGNDMLCGGIPALKLPSCPEQVSRKRGRVLPLRVLISVVVTTALCLLLLSAFLATRFWWKKTGKNLSSTSSLRKGFLEVSYADLLKSTNGFSSNNLIGVGSYGSVYKGNLNCIETTVAVKVLNLHQQRASKSFLLECEALRNIRHRNIVKIITVCSSTDFSGNDFKALVFEYMPNGSLDMWLHPNESEQEQFTNLNLIQRMNIAIDVACAMEYLHHHCEKAIVHCDLKPSNVLLDEEMVVHVGDFGLAKIIHQEVINHSQTSTSSLAVKGSIGYVAPEYGLRGDPSTYGDVYSYVILLLEMLTGRRPTNNMFKDNMSLHQYAKMMLPDQVMEIIDHHLLLDVIESIKYSRNANKMRNAIQESLISMMRIGVSCSVESPKERMDMRDVVTQLHKVKESFLADQ